MKLRALMVMITPLMPTPMPAASAPLDIPWCNGGADWGIPDDVAVGVGNVALAKAPKALAANAVCESQIDPSAVYLPHQHLRIKN